MSFKKEKRIVRGLKMSWRRGLHVGVNEIWLGNQGESGGRGERK